MDKDNRDDFTFAKLCDIKLPVTFRMCEPFPVLISGWLSKHQQFSAWGCQETALIHRSPGRPRAEVPWRPVCVCNYYIPSAVAEGFMTRTRSLSDLYVTCQLVADNKPLTIPFRTSFKAFKNSYSQAGLQFFLEWMIDFLSSGGMNGLCCQFGIVTSPSALRSPLLSGILVVRALQ